MIEGRPQCGRRHSCRAMVTREDLMAAAVLQMMGFKKVLNLAGGYVRWEAEGKPQVREAEY